MSERVGPRQAPRPLPLDGITVVELGQNLAGPLAGQILADLGADLVKVEKPDGGDDARGWGPPFADGAAIAFHGMNRNKRSVVLDLRDAAGRERLLRLVAAADVFVENLRPGTTVELGLGPETLLDVNPRLVYCAVAAFGHAGPLREKPGYEILLQAYGGLMSMTGEPDRPPVRMGAPILDYGTGVWTALAAIAALRERDRTGRGAIVRTSLLETALFWMSGHIARYLASGEVPERHPTGSQRLVGFQAFETRNGPIVVAAGNDRLWAKLARAVGRPEWTEDARFKVGADRYRHRHLLVPALEAIFATDDKERWMDRLEAAGVPCAPILTVPEVVADAQTQALGMIQPLPEIGVDVLSLPVTFDGTRLPIRRRSPRLGEHTDEVLGDAAAQTAWDPQQYLAFSDHRMRPAVDLLQRVGLAAPARIVDLGCGAGNVTGLLRQRWPDAHVTGVDASPAMLERARASDAAVDWQLADVRAWSPPAPVDLLFSNAALHWLDDHASLFPALAACVAPGGVLAIQMPRNFDEPSHTSIYDTVRTGPWRARLEPLIRAQPSRRPADYWELLVGRVRALDIWETVYWQALDGDNPVAEFVKGSWLGPFLEALAGDERARFEAAYRERVRRAYPPRANGQTLFPFRRLFIVARC